MPHIINFVHASPPQPSTAVHAYDYLMLTLCILSRSFLCSLLKDFRVSHACHAHSVVRSRVSDALSQALCNLSLAFVADFTLSDSTDLIRFISFLPQITLCFSFGSKDMITAFTCLPSYRYSSFTLGAYLCWRHTYCKWPIIELAKNVSPKNKIAARHVVQIHTHARFPRSKNGRLIM